MGYQNSSRNQNINKTGYGPSFIKINEPLSQKYLDKAALFLEGGIAHSAAIKFKYIAPHQLRKVLNQTKQSIVELEKKDYDLQKSINNLYALLPLAAYNAGRDKNLKPLYEFLVAHINKETLISENDLIVFDELFTSIVAYHKFVVDGGKR